MPMFHTPKPRQFHYQPRFYDPEKEKWEALKQKYADERTRRELLEQSAEASAAKATEAAAAGQPQTSGQDGNGDLAYFQRRVREMDREEKRRGLTWQDMFRKREMPEFHYQPRFATSESTAAEGAETTGEHLHEFKKRSTKIKRRFDIEDEDYMKPMPAGRIMLYTLLVCILLYWILF